MCEAQHSMPLTNFNIPWWNVAMSATLALEDSHGLCLRGEVAGQALGCSVRLNARGTAGNGAGYWAGSFSLPSWMNLGSPHRCCRTAFALWISSFNTHVSQRCAAILSVDKSIISNLNLSSFSFQPLDPVMSLSIHSKNLLLLEISYRVEQITSIIALRSSHCFPRF